MSVVEARAPGSRERQRVATRERVFLAGLDEIRRAGVAGAQVDRIVAGLGISRGTFYFHFPTKEQVLLEWERRREVELLERLGGATVAAPRSLRASLLEVVTFLGRLLSSPGERQLVLDTLAIHVREGANPTVYPLLGEIERRIAAAAARGDVRKDLDPRALAVLFLGNVVGFVVGSVDPSAPHPEAEMLVDVFLSGVTARGHAPRARRTRRPRAGA